jgi:hypothetical protein
MAASLKNKLLEKFEPFHVETFLPQILINEVLQEAHSHLLIGHSRVLKMKEIIFNAITGLVGM